MTQLTTTDLARLRRQSHRAAWVSGLGAAMIFAAIGYSIWQLASLQQGIAAKQVELKQATTQAQALHAEAQSLEDQISALRKQKDELQSGLKAIDSLFAAKKTTPLAASVRKLTPLSADVKPQAEAAPVSGLFTPDGKQEYDFSLWLQVPSMRSGEIKSVSYQFNHPTFNKRLQASSDASSGFRVGYRGWGCLHRIIITLILRDGSSQPIDFDMCTALGW